MPITVERFTSIISIAELSIQCSDTMREELERIKESLVSLKRELHDAAEYPRSLVFDIETSTDMALKSLRRITPQFREELTEQKTKIQMNMKKNRNQKLKKRIQRLQHSDEEMEKQLQEMWDAADPNKITETITEDELDHEVAHPQQITTDTYDPPKLMPKRGTTGL